MRTERSPRWAAEGSDIAVCVAFGCAGFLLLGIVMPDWFARTSWSSGTENAFTTVFDSPASYVGLVSLCGLVAFVTLAVGLWQRWAVAAALAAAAFAGGAYVAASYWLGLSRGVMLIDGRPEPALGPPEWTVHWPLALPLFFCAAIAGTLSALALASYWWRLARR